MLKATLDTNVLISGTFWEGEAYKIIQLVEGRKVRCFLSRQILAEYSDVMHSEEILDKVGKHHLHVKSAIIKVMEISTIVEPKRKLYAVQEDPEDNKILECAVEAGADFIITYDEKHLLKMKEFEGIRIVSPGEFLKKHFK